MEATVQGIRALRERDDLDVVSLQEIHAEARRSHAALPVVGEEA
jgi:hypothetical protein